MKLVTLTRPLWREIARTAAGASREIGGCLIGRRTRVGSVVCHHNLTLAHEIADRWRVKYDFDEVAKARHVAFSRFGPALEPVGGWHVHIYDRLIGTNECVAPSKEDIEEMQIGDLEVIVATAPFVPSGCNRAWRYRWVRDSVLATVFGCVLIRASAFLRTRDGAERMRMSLV